MHACMHVHGWLQHPCLRICHTGTFPYLLFEKHRIAFTVSSCPGVCTDSSSFPSVTSHLRSASKPSLVSVLESGSIQNDVVNPFLVSVRYQIHQILLKRSVPLESWLCRWQLYRKRERCVFISTPLQLHGASHILDQRWCAGCSPPQPPAAPQHQQLT